MQYPFNPIRLPFPYNPPGSNYKTPPEIYADLQQIVQNCEYYNPDPESNVRKCLAKFQQCYQNRYQQLVKQFEEQAITIDLF
jgi:hypothetical protein